MILKCNETIGQLPKIKEKNMKRILKSGNVFMGTCGDTTGLYDSDGNSLHVGDLVAVWTQDVKNRGWNDEPAYVVKEQGGDPFIMGLKTAHLVREYILDGDVSDEEHYDTVLDTYRCDADLTCQSKDTTWSVIRIKTFNQTADEEFWGGVRPVSEDSETDLEDGITVCCGYDFGMDQFDDAIRFCPKCGRRIRKSRNTLAKKERAITSYEDE